MKEQMLRTAGVALLTLSVYGCKDNKSSKVQPNVQPQLTSSLTVEPHETAQPSQLSSEEMMMRFYPDGVDFSLKENLSINNPDNIPTSIYNFSDRQINATVASELYRIFSTDSVFKQPFTESFGLEKLTYELYAQPRKQVSQRAFVLLPNDISGPSESLRQSFEDAATTVDASGVVFSFARKVDIVQRLAPFNTPVEYLTAEFAVEICQQSLQIGYKKDQGSIHYDDSPVGTLRQEVFCNSMGEAVAARFLNVPYLEYVANVGTRNLFDQPPIMIPQKDYEAVSILGPILK